MLQVLVLQVLQVALATPTASNTPARCAHDSPTPAVVNPFDIDQQHGKVLKLDSMLIDGI